MKKLAADRLEEYQPCGREYGRQYVHSYPGSMDKDKPYISAFRGTESGNHAPELSEITVIFGLKMGKSGLKWCEGRNIKDKE